MTIKITPAQIRAAHEALGLDPDLTMGVSISPGYVHVTGVQLDDDGRPVFRAGAPQRVETGVQVEGVEE